MAKALREAICERAPRLRAEAYLEVREARGRGRKPQNAPAGLFSLGEGEAGADADHPRIGDLSAVQAVQGLPAQARAQVSLGEEPE